MKLVLGTAQFGFKYGFKKRKVSSYEIKKILKIIKRNKISYFDTAINYGNSQTVIGNLNINKNIITKITFPVKNIKNIESWFYKKIYNSLKELKINKLYGLLIHNPSDIINSENKFEFIRLLQEAKKKKIILYHGISVYEKEEVYKILKFFRPDILQFPLNIFDQRFLKKNFTKKLKKLKIKIFVRSCFLQGLLLQSSLKKRSNEAQKIFNSFLEWCLKKKITQVEGCLQFIKRFKFIDFIILGFDNANQLTEIIKVLKKKEIYVPNIFLSKNLKIIDPRKW